MIVAPPKRPRSTQESILPLINIVFLLLIFFMLAGVLARKPPFELTAPHTVQTEKSAHLKRRVLSIAADGRLALGDTPVKREDLDAALAGWPKGKPLQIRADGSIEAVSLTGLFAALRRAGVDQVDLLTRHENP